MNLLQYAFTLGDAYDMQTIRDRVAARRSRLSGLPGLRWKAWLLSEPTPRHPQPKTYAPLYLFANSASTASFLGGSIYEGVTASFGWTWPFQGPSLGVQSGLDAARACVLEVQTVKTHAELALALEDDLPGHPAEITQARMLDVARMQLRTYRFLDVAAAQVATESAHVVYEVVALTQPCGDAR